MKLLPEHQFKIPQKNGMTAPIPTISAEEDVTTLGFTNDLRNSGRHQVKVIVNQGNEWAYTMNTNRFLKRDDV